VWNLEKEVLDSKRHAGLHVLRDFCYVSKGACVNSDEKIAKGEFKKNDLISDIQDDLHPRKYIEPKDFERYYINRERYLEYGTKRSPHKWREPRFPEFFIPPKIFITKLGKMQATLDIDNQFIHNESTIGLVLWKDLKSAQNKSISGNITKYSKLSRNEMEGLSEKVNLYYLLAILNSKYASHLLDIQRGGGFCIYPDHIRSLPIPIASKEDMKMLSEYAKKELELHAKLKEAKLESDRDVIQKAIMALDDKIDQIIYKIYELSKDDIEKLK